MTSVSLRPMSQIHNNVGLRAETRAPTSIKLLVHKYYIGPLCGTLIHVEWSNRRTFSGF